MHILSCVIVAKLQEGFTDLQRVCFHFFLVYVYINTFHHQICFYEKNYRATLERFIIKNCENPTKMSKDFE